jgi:hypothetical protein
MWNTTSFYTSIFKNCGECKMQLDSNGFNMIQNEWFNSCVNVDSSKNVRSL